MTASPTVIWCRWQFILSIVPNRGVRSPLLSCLRARNAYDFVPVFVYVDRRGTTFRETSRTVLGRRTHMVAVLDRKVLVGNDP
jgi:hypothetical protein